MSSAFINLKRFKKQQLIGKGSFGKVFKVLERGTEKIFAAKISLTELRDEDQSEIVNLKREINIISELNHPSVLKFIGYSPINFKQKLKPVIITEYSSNGSLDKILELERRSLSPNSWDDTKKLINIYGIASAMSYLHSHNIIHRDLKPANILEDDYLFPKIADFGLSKIYHQNTASKASQSLAGFKGTPAFMAPECIEKYEYTKACDVYAFSIIVYEMITLEEPYQNLSIPSLLYEVARVGHRPEFKHPIAECYKNLITKCWSEDPNERPSFSEIVSELKNNPEFIIDGIDKKEYFEYIDLIENSDISFDPSKKFKKITISDSPELISELDLLPKDFDFCEIEGFYQLSKDFQDTFINTLSCQNAKLLKSITIHTEELSILYSNKSLDSTNFIKLLKYFEEIIIEIKYPTSNFESIFDIISDEWLLIMNTLKVNIIISDIKSIGSYLKKKSIPFTVTIVPNTLTEIGYYAFNECSSLTQITIPSTVTSIGGGAFSDCISLKHITIPSSVNKIRKYTFRDCSSLKYISIPSPIIDFERSAFNGCTSLEEINIPSSVKKIRENVFKCCSSLTEITIPSSVTKIESNCFERCSSLKIVTIPSSVTIIEESAFERCSSLEKIIIPLTITEIGANAFERCSELKSFTIPTSLTVIEESCFIRCSSLEEINIPSSVKKIEIEAFAECSSLSKITIPSSVEKIKSSAFAGCSSLTEIMIPDSVQQIESKTFRGCSSLVKITINSSINLIDESFCNGCSSLKEFKIPSSVTSIGSSSFRGCSSLFDISFPSFVKEIGNYAFGGCSSLNKIVFPSSLNSIGSYAFSGCSLLEQISFESPSSLNSIGSYAFSGCSSIKEIEIPSSVALIDEFAFSGCSALNKILIFSDKIDIKSSVFNETPALIEVLVNSCMFDNINQKKKDYSIDDICNVKIIE